MPSLNYNYSTNDLFFLSIDTSFEREGSYPFYVFFIKCLKIEMFGIQAANRI